MKYFIVYKHYLLFRIKFRLNIKKFWQNKIIRMLYLYIGVFNYDFGESLVLNNL